jgi:hypothetical protein
LQTAAKRVAELFLFRRVSMSAVNAAVRTAGRGVREIRRDFWGGFRRLANRGNTEQPHGGFEGRARLPRARTMRLSTWASANLMRLMRRRRRGGVGLAQQGDERVGIVGVAHFADAGGGHETRGRVGFVGEGGAQERRAGAVLRVGDGADQREAAFAGEGADEVLAELGERLVGESWRRAARLCRPERARGSRGLRRGVRRRGRVRRGEFAVRGEPDVVRKRRARRMASQ